MTIDAHRSPQTGDDPDNAAMPTWPYRLAAKGLHMLDFLITSNRTLWRKVKPRLMGRAVSSAQRLAPMVLEFEQALDGITSPASLRLQGRIRAAKSRSELWYFRVDVFDLVSHALGQHEAQVRLNVLNDLFASSGRRSGPIPL